MQQGGRCSASVVLRLSTWSVLLFCRESFLGGWSSVGGKFTSYLFAYDGFLQGLGLVPLVEGGLVGVPSVVAMDSSNHCRWV